MWCIWSFSVFWQCFVYDLLSRAVCNKCHLYADSQWVICIQLFQKHAYILSVMLHSGESGRKPLKNQQQWRERERYWKEWQRPKTSIISGASSKWNYLAALSPLRSLLFSLEAGVRKGVGCKQRPPDRHNNTTIRVQHLQSHKGTHMQREIYAQAYSRLW